MLAVENIQCRYGDKTILHDLSFKVNRGDICSLLGPSGCGKTTALRAIAGFQPLSQGTISLSGDLLSDKNRTIEPEFRQIGMVFQDYALFPHLSVRENISFGIRRNPAQKKIVDDLLALTKLEDTQQRFPHELSGGQQQRVALARALAPNPKLLLLDEPFSNLDIELRRHLNLEIREILKSYGTSAILVTHDQEEAFAFADQIGLIYEGVLQQWDSAFNLYHKPNSRFVADFIGQGQFVSGTANDQFQVNTEFGVFDCEQSQRFDTGSAVDVLLRPDDIVLDSDAGIEVRVTKKVFSGSATLYSLQSSTGTTINALLSSQHDFSLGQQLQIAAKGSHLIAFRNDGGNATNK